MAENKIATGASDALTAALRLTASMASEENVLMLLGRGLSLAVNVLDCERGLLITQDTAGENEIIRSEGHEAEVAPFSTTALRLVQEKNEPLLISDTAEDSMLSVQQSISTHDIRSVLCARLDAIHEIFADKRVYLYLDSRADRRPFTNDDLEKFRLLSLLMANLLSKSDLMARQEATIEELRNRVEERELEDLVFSSENFKSCITLVKQAAPADVPVLLMGETGTGKEVLARLVHSFSARSGQPFLAVNCGAIPENLMESQLFGHEKGAFTGAVSARKGFFEEASGGTLFLDEVGELPLQVQSQFLRVLQQGEIVRVGATKPIPVDVRIVSATNVDLEKGVEHGRFRKDLLFRLNVIPVTVPPIRERGEDALLLARFFLKRYAEKFGMPVPLLSREAEKAILVYDWPGNVREIQNRMQRAVITSAGLTISRDGLGLESSQGSRYADLREAREAVDREMIDYAMQRAPGNLTNAAKILGIDRKSLRILLDKYEISY